MWDWRGGSTMYVENRIAGEVVVNVIMGEAKLTNKKEEAPMYSIR